LEVVQWVAKMLSPRPIAIKAQALIPALEAALEEVK
jgi:hypothetical protein